MKANVEAVEVEVEVEFVVVCELLTLFGNSLESAFFTLVNIVSLSLENYVLCALCPEGITSPSLMIHPHTPQQKKLIARSNNVINDSHTKKQQPTNSHNC